MKLFSLLLLAGGISAAGLARAHELEICGRGFSQVIAAPVRGPESPEYRKYAPDREIDILHLTLDVTPDFKARTVAGKATWKFKPIAKPFRELKLDAVDLSVSSVTSTEKVLGYQVTGEKVIVTFAEEIAPDREASVTVHYSATPLKGLYFRTPELGFKPEDMHLWTQGEPTEARHWYPSYDFPNEKFTTEMICHVPDGIVVLSNGRKISEENDDAGLVAVRWLQDKPHVNYLVALVAGKLKFIEEKHGDIPMRFWTPATEIEHAKNSFEDTKPCMEFFEKEIGVPYPWDKYDQVCIQDYHWGGMENTTLTTLNINTLFPDGYDKLRSSQGLVAHELAHQWFGDLLTCKDWSHIWLNEGFASFYDLLYTEHKDGRDEFLDDLYGGAKAIIAQTNTVKSIVWRKYGDPVEQFDYLAYGKGAWVLNMLRNQLGPDLFRRCVKTYVERHKFGSVVTDDLRAVIEELSGRSYDQFFDQWVYHTGYPVLDVDYSWDEQAKLAKLSVRQTHAVNENVVLFNISLPVRLKTKSSVVERMVNVKDRAEDFFFPLSEQPQIVRIDPNLSVLAKINFKPATAMLHAMLADRGDVVGRFIACEQLQEKKDRDAVNKLKETLNSDSFWGVRSSASRALRTINTDEAFDALASSLKQSDARVRRQVVSDVTGFFRPEAFDQALTVLKSEKNPDIKATALRALDSATNANVRTILIEHLNTDSFRQHLTDTAISAIRARNDPAYIDPLRDVLSKRAMEFQSRTLANGLDTLAYLAREQDNKDRARDLIVGFVNHPRQSIKVAAINALGTLRDDRALAVLERFTAAQKESPERMAAERAMESIRGARKSTVELGDLRREMLELQKQNRELRKDFDALKKKSDATSQPRPTKR